MTRWTLGGITTQPTLLVGLDTAAADGTVERTALVLRVALVADLRERNKVETAAARLVGVR